MQPAKPYTILAIDSATGPCSVALWKNGRVASCLENMQPHSQSAALMPMVEEILLKDNLVYGGLSAIAATIGPGSFTGIRVGLAAARGIAFAAGIKSLGFTTLEVMAFAARAQAKHILAVLNAGKGEFYAQRFATAPHFHAVSEAMLGKPEDIMSSACPETYVVSNADTSRPSSVICHPSAAALAELAATHETGAQPLTPFYIRPPDAKLPAKKL